MEIQGISSPISPSTQKVTEVTNRVEGEVAVNKGVQVNQKVVEASKELLQEQVESLNKTLEQMGQAITFGLDSSTNSTVVKVFDRSTEELIRQFPSEDSLKVMKNIQEYLEKTAQSGRNNNEGLTGSIFNEII